MNNIKIGIVLGSDSDFPHLEPGLKLVKSLGIPFQVEVSSAHRTPERTLELVRDFENQGVKVIIAAAGGAAHLPGVIAAHTHLPVLGVPIPSPLGGLDSLYSIVQMPGGIPVATFGLGKSGGTNAVLFALQMLALEDSELAEKIRIFRKEQSAAVEQKSQRLQEKIKSL